MMHLVQRIRDNRSSERRGARLRAAFSAVERTLRGRPPRFAGSTEPTPLAEPAAPEPLATEETNDQYDSIRVLRWVYSRGRDFLTCELALSDDDALYELRSTTSANPAAGSVERFTEVTAAFARQCALERSLVTERWTLDAYESLRVDRRRAPPVAV